MAEKYNSFFYKTPEKKAKFKEIKEAYNILSNPYKRDRYDVGLDIFNASEEIYEKDKLIETQEFK